MKKSHLVIVPASGISHFQPTIELAKRLIQQEDQLSITILVMKDIFKPSVNGYIESLSASVTEVQFIELPPAEPPSPELMKSMEGYITVVMQNHKPQLKEALIKLISNPNSIPVTGVVIDFFSTAFIDVANELGLPSYILFTSTASFLGLLLHLPTLDTQITTDFKDSDTELILPGFVSPVPPAVLPSALLKKNDDSYKWYLYHGRRFKEAKGIIVNSSSQIEPNAINSFSGKQIQTQTHTPLVYPVGPLIDLEGQTYLPSDRTHLHQHMIKWLDDQPSSSVILLCFGNLGIFDAAQVKEIALGLEQSGQRFLWVLRRRPPDGKIGIVCDYTNFEEILPYGFIERTKGRGLVCGRIPQVAILSHPAIGGFASHCGWNSILESLWFGVPILTWPLYAEQQLNAFMMVKELGLAVELKLDSRIKGGDLVTAVEIERGVRHLMEEDSEVRRKVKEMGEKSREALMDGGSSFASLGRLIDDLMEG